MSCLAKISSMAAFMSAALVLLPQAAAATPQFARTYRVDCTHCHAAPPRLNEQGIRFVAAGYRLERPAGRSRTVPVAIWNTLDTEWRHSGDLVKAYPGRVEIISAGPVGGTRASYFAEWRALSQSLRANGRLVDRSGRFEDLFVRVPVTPARTLALTVGQFRALTQVDVSLRLSLSEPLVFTSSLPGPARARNARLSNLRAFSAAGRQPAFRLEYQQTRPSPGDGWFVAATLPVAGELTMPFTDAASFELESRPKGVFLESFRRAGLASVGGHVFLGDGDRRFGTLVLTGDVARRLAIIGGIGVFHAAGTTDTRLSAGAEMTVSPQAVGGIRIDHRTGHRRDPVLLLYGNGHFPFGIAAVRQAFRVQLEHRVQPRNHATTLALSHVF